MYILIIISYYLIIFGGYILMSQSKTTAQLKKYVQGILALGFFLLAVAFIPSDDYDKYTIIFTSGMLSIILLYYFIKNMLTNKDKISFIEIPENAYEVEVVEEVYGTVIIRYILKYNNKSYQLSTIPPKNRPPVTLIVYNIDEEVPRADMIIKKKEKSLYNTVATFRDTCALVSAIALPIVVLIALKVKDLAFLVGALLTLMLGAIFWKMFENGKTVFLKCLYYFSIFLFATALLNLLMHFLAFI